MYLPTSVDIRLEPDHLDLIERLREFVSDRLESIVDLEESEPDTAFPTLVKELSSAGLLAEMVPQEFGGNRPRLDTRAICLVREALAGVSGLADLIFVMQGLGSFPLQNVGSSELKSTWLPRVATGEAIAALALTEEFAGSDVAAIQTSARRSNGSYVLDGEKWFISNAGFASFYSVFAVTDRYAGRKGLSCLLVEADRPGCAVVRQMHTLAPHPLGVVAFTNCIVPVENLLGEEGGGFALAMRTLDTFRTSVGAAALGMAGRALQEATRFAKQREQFGRPLSEFQMTQAALAEMALDYEAARLLVYRAATARDHGAERVTLEASLAKLHATEAAQRVVDRALQLHGGRGLLKGSVTERLYRDVRALRIYEGTSEIQKLVIAAQVLKAFESDSVVD